MDALARLWTNNKTRVLLIRRRLFWIYASGVLHFDFTDALQAVCRASTSNTIADRETLEDTYITLQKLPQRDAIIEIEHGH
jgi:hypothetical protein